MAGARGRERLDAKYTGTAVALLAIWLAVLLTSLFAPDLVSGTEQEHLPIAALTNWFWVSISTAFALVPLTVRRRDRATEDVWWWLLGGLTTVIWTVVTIVSVFAPRAETGTDPTRIPVAAMLSPITATVATGMLAGYVAVLSRTD